MLTQYEVTVKVTVHGNSLSDAQEAVEQRLTREVNRSMELHKSITGVVPLGCRNHEVSRVLSMRTVPVKR